MKTYTGNQKKTHSTPCGNASKFVPPMIMQPHQAEHRLISNTKGNVSASLAPDYGWSEPERVLMRCTCTTVHVCLHRMDCSRHMLTVWCIIGLQLAL